MKSLKDYSLNLTEEQYHAYPAWSQSLISRYAREGFKAMANIHEPITPTASMEFGSLFDSVITRGKETLNHYVVFDMSVPPAEKAVLDVLASNCTCTQFFDISKDEVISFADQVGYQTRWGKDTRYSHISAFEQYYNVIQSGKKIISQQDWNDAMEMFNAFRSSPYLKELFGTKSTKDIEYIYQPQFLVDMPLPSGKVVKVKVMVDLIVVNHKEKTIQLVDLKTSAMPAYDFAENFVKYRYDIEAAVYTDVVDIIRSMDEEYLDYKMLPFLFTDISRVDKVPVTYEYDPRSESQFTGFSFKDYHYKPYYQLLDEMVAYEEDNAVVPSYIKTEEPNDMVAILNNR
jgi:hypothetical protein